MLPVTHTTSPSGSILFANILIEVDAPTDRLIYSFPWAGGSFTGWTVINILSELYLIGFPSSLTV